MKSDEKNSPIKHSSGRLPAAADFCVNAYFKMVIPALDDYIRPNIGERDIFEGDVGILGARYLLLPEILEWRILAYGIDFNR